MTLVELKNMVTIIVIAIPVLAYLVNSYFQFRN